MAYGKLKSTRMCPACKQEIRTNDELTLCQHRLRGGQLCDGSGMSVEGLPLGPTSIPDYRVRADGTARHVRAECTECGRQIAVEWKTGIRFPHLGRDNKKCKKSGTRANIRLLGRPQDGHLHPCPACDKKVQINVWGRLYSHQNRQLGKLCDGSDVKVAERSPTGRIRQIVEVSSPRKQEPVAPIDISRRSSATSVHTVSGGLPSSNRRRH